MWVNWKTRNFPSRALKLLTPLVKLETLKVSFHVFWTIDLTPLLELESTKMPSPWFLNMLIPHLRSSRIEETDLDGFSARVFSKLFDVQGSDSENL